MEFAVGTALASIPIMLTAYDRYRDLSAGFSTFRHYSKELKKLDRILGNQKILFRADVVKLLTAITNDPEKARDLLFNNGKDRRDGLLTNDPEKARNLLFNNSKDRWDELLRVHDRNRLELLQETFMGWNETLEQVRSAVTAICDEVESFRSSNLVHAGQTLPSREILKQLPRRFRLCWEKKKVKDSIKDLRDGNEELSKLTTHIVNELKEIKYFISPVREILIRRNVNQVNSLEKYRQIQSASYRLYNTFALQWSCARHQRHAASISLANDSTSAQTQPRDMADGIKFGVAISYEADSPTCRETPIWLEVESVDPGLGNQKQHEATEPKNKLNEALTHEISRPIKHSQPMASEKVEKVHKKLVKKAVPFQPTTARSIAAVDNGGLGASTMAVAQMNTRGGGKDDKDEGTVTISTTTTDVTADSMVNLMKIEDFCQHFQVPQSIPPYTCVGYIEDSNLHRFYIPAPERRLGQRKSLAEIISWISEDKISGSFPRIVIARLASSLAAAVLQYHSTPWLPETWQSSHVCFFGIDELTEDTSSFTSPYLNAELPKTNKGKGLNLSRFTTTATAKTTTNTSPNATSTTAITSTPDDSSTSPLLARNELLFRFGIMLLELGYSKPWPRLKQSILDDLPEHKRTDYHAAEKLAQRRCLREGMGPRFPTIVRKCLGCDFGLGENDFAKEELQEMFLVHVVEALQEMERVLRELERKLEHGVI